MIPMVSTDLLNDFREVKQPDKTYLIEGNRISGFADGLKAVIQAARLILSTERFEHSIYSWNYGAELKGIIGLNPPLAQSLLKQRVIEALTQDDRITGVDDFSFMSKGNKLTAKFTVSTVYGSFSDQLESMV